MKIINFCLFNSARTQQIIKNFIKIFTVIFIFVIIFKQATFALNTAAGQVHNPDQGAGGNELFGIESQIIMQNGSMSGIEIPSILWHSTLAKSDLLGDSGPSSWTDSHISHRTASSGASWSPNFKALSAIIFISGATFLFTTLNNFDSDESFGFVPALNAINTGDSTPEQFGEDGFEESKTEGSVNNGPTLEDPWPSPDEDDLPKGQRNIPSPEGSNAVPEPTTIILFAGGALGLLFRKT